MSPLLITVIIILLAILLLSFTRIRPDVIALIVMLSLGLTNVVDQSQTFSGFSSSAVMTILGISMVSVALQQTGVANALGKLIFQIAKNSETSIIFFVTLSSAVLSLFMNNIAAVGVLLPAVMALSRRSRISPSRLLMPLAFGTLLGGMATLLTTSNIIVSAALKDAGYVSFGLLDYFPVGAPVIVVGLIYLITLGKKLLPTPTFNESGTVIQKLSDRLMDLYLIKSNLNVYGVQPGSLLTEKSIQNGWSSQSKLSLYGVIRKNKTLLSPSPETIIKPEDRLIVQGELSNEEINFLSVESIPGSISNNQLVDDSTPLAELIVSPHSRLIGKDLCKIDFRNRYGLRVLSISRRGKPMLTGFSCLDLEAGDTLLAQGSANHIHQLQQDEDLILLEEDPDTVYRPKKMWLAIAITVFTLGIASIDLLPVAQVVLAGAVLLLLTGCMSITDAFQKIEWKAIFLIAGMWPLTIAIRETGLAEIVTNFILGKIGNISPLVIAAFLLFVSLVFTQFLSGPVAPIVIIPLALTAAKTFNIDPHPLAMAVALGCSLGFMTPLGHPVNIMVMNPGGYTFKDFWRVGLPLTLLAFITILIGLHVIWGL